jgi:esterase/lipase superfamily enzyme
MKRELHTIHSDALGQDMSMIVYGEKGYPIVTFQTQDHTCESFEQDGLLEPLAEYIDGGRIQLFSVDNADQGSWSDLAGDKAKRAQRQEDYFRFVTDELLPQVHELNGSELRPLAIGCSMGATHAALAALRRPDLFQGCLSLSGVYRASYFFGDWSNPTLYDNDIVSFLPNMPLDHPYVELYRHRSLLF